MSLIIPHHLPAVEILRQENILLTDNFLSSEENIRPLKIAILNLMPVKITTETDFVRLLSNSSLQIELDFLKIKSHVSKNTSCEHLDAFYKHWDDIRDQNYDGMIVTGAPVELLDFEDVRYWNELTEIFDWARNHVRSTLYICWGAQAALYYFYQVPKYPLKKKMFGVFKHTLQDPKIPLFRGFDDEFYVPHSRHTEVRREDIVQVSELSLLSESTASGVYMAMSGEGREIFVTGHSEYAPDTLHNEFIRDLKKGLPIRIPDNYYVDNDPDKGISVRWRAHANLLFVNWLNYYVRQT